MNLKTCIMLDISRFEILQSWEIVHWEFFWFINLLTNVLSADNWERIVHVFVYMHLNLFANFYHQFFSGETLYQQNIPEQKHVFVLSTKKVGLVLEKFVSVYLYLYL